MRSFPVRAILLGLGFAIVLGAAFSFVGSPWSTAWDWPFVWPILVGAGLGLVYGAFASWRLRLGWLVWLLTLPAVGAWTWAAVEQCNATTPGDDCSIAWIIPLGWLVPWAIGIAMLVVAQLVVSRGHSGATA